MHILEKRAWFMFIAMVAALVCWGVAVAIFGLREFTFAAFAIGGLGGFNSIVGHREQRSGRLIIDERDARIASNSMLAAWGVLWVLFVIGGIVPMLIWGPSHMLHLETSRLALLVSLATCAGFFIQSIATIIQYRRAAGGE